MVTKRIGWAVVPIAAVARLQSDLDELQERIETSQQRPKDLTDKGQKRKKGAKKHK